MNTAVLNTTRGLLSAFHHCRRLNLPLEMVVEDIVRPEVSPIYKELETEEREALLYFMKQVQPTDYDEIARFLMEGYSLIDHVHHLVQTQDRITET